MGLHAVEGDVGGGKSFIAVHDLMAGYLRDTSRPVYTNLPVDGAQLEYYLCWLSRNAAKREAMRRRLHFLRSGPQVAFYDYWVDPRLEGEPERYRDDEGRCLALPGEVSWPEDEETEAEYRDFGFERRRRQLPELHDGIREFWYFCAPNAVVFLDEVADTFNALNRDGSKEGVQKRGVLQSFINHHRHYLLDLYFFMQSRDDVDVQVRRKIKYVYYVENSKTLNMFKWWLLRGLRWPLQFFRVRVFVGRKVLGRGADFDMFEPTRTYVVWPTKRRYLNYRSFAAASTGFIRGMRLARKGARSTDMDTWWDRVKDWVVNAGLPLGLGVGACVAVYCGLQFIYGMAGMDSNKAGELLGYKKGESNAVPMVVKAKGGSSNGPVVIVGNGGSTNRLAKPERVVFLSPAYVRTSDGRVFKRGYECGGRIVSGFDFAGVQFLGGSRVAWAVLLRGDGSEGVRCGPGGE